MKPLSLFLFFAAIAPAWAGNGLIGSGSDGLFGSELEWPATGVSDVTVPIPGEHFGTLRFTADLSNINKKWQYGLLYVYRCEMGSNGEPLKFGCQELTLPINQDNVVRAGTYFNALGQPLEVRENASTEVRLQKINVTKSKLGTVTYRLFRDLSEPAELRNLSRHLWMNAFTKKRVKKHCTPPSNDRAAQFCNMATTIETPYELQGYMYVTREGKVRWNFSPDNSEDFLWISEVEQSGESTFVFPGALYGIEFTNERGEKSYRYGIRP